MQEKSGLKNIYRFYKPTSYKSVPFNVFKRVWTTFITEVMKDIIQGGKDFSMPSLGSIGIRKQKVIVAMTPEGDIDKRYLRPDWKATKDLWSRDKKAKKNKQLVFHLNKHFNGFNCKFVWDKRTCSVANNTAYSLIMTREHKRELSRVIQDENIEVDYYEQKPRVRHEQ